MKKHFLMLTACIAGSLLSAQQVNIIPKPVSQSKQPGQFRLTANTRIVFDWQNEGLANLAQYASEYLGKPLGFKLSTGLVATDPEKNIIFLQLNQPLMPEPVNEGYELQVTADNIFLRANTRAGIFYGIQTLWQMLVPNGPALNCCTITDYPRFAWRGLHLDVSRHFMPIGFIYKYIDYMALHKVNVFHWHLVDDQGWRIEIKKYPKLTEVGAWRVDRKDQHWNSRQLAKASEKATYGGFYTQDEIRKVVQYASFRNITIVPEIEMPAHVMSALAAYPEYSCTGKNLGVPPGGVWPITHIYCAGKNETFGFLQDILTEVMEVFPSTYIHVGGDEADKTEWQKCPLCQKRIRDERLKDEHGLQSYFITRIEKFLSKHGRKLIGWDEILEGGLAPQATVMSWRGEAGGIEAAKMAHHVVMTPSSHCYFDYYQGDPSVEPLAIGGFTTLKKVYLYEPIPADLNGNQGRFVLGAQANTWTEYMPNPAQVEYMVFPRLAALSEVVWSPKETRNWADFSERMNVQYERYKLLGINYSKSAFQVTARSKIDTGTRTLGIELFTEAHNPEIRYTIDGSEPGINSPKYDGPLFLSQTSTVKSAVFSHGKPLAPPLSRQFWLHRALACHVAMKYPNSSKYNGSGEYTLVDGIRGSSNYADGNWKGFAKDDLVATIDLGKSTNIGSLETDALQNVDSWIFLPSEVVFEVSTDGVIFSKLGRVTHNISVDQPGKFTHSFLLKKQARGIRYVRVTSRNLGMCPKHHPGEGKSAWLFVSEIIVHEK